MSKFFTRLECLQSLEKEMIIVLLLTMYPAELKSRVNRIWYFRDALYDFSRKISD